MDIKTKENSRWFNWHLFPEEPIKVRSFIEMAIFFIIVSICFFLYYRWNIVPIKEIEIQIEDLSDGVAHNISHGRIDSIRRVLTCDFQYNIPMTRHDELIENPCSYTIKFRPLYSNDKYSEFLNYTFLKDSIRNGLIINDSCASIFIKEHDLEKEFDKINIRPISKIKSKYLDSFKKILVDSLDVSGDSVVMGYIATKQSPPLIYSGKPWIKSKDNHEIINQYLSDDKKYYHYNTYFYMSNWTHEDYPETEIRGLQRESYKNSLHKFANYFNIYKPFKSTGLLMTPKWGRLEDISQAYIRVKLKSLTIDSIVLNLNFVGATEFTAMDPAPDKVGMSNIVFNDPIKIYKIKANGLKFHARFIELENWQQIRVFTVTTIMSAFVLIFVVFAISAYFKIRKRIKEDKASNKTKLIKWITISFLGIILYSLIYWTFMEFVIDETNANFSLYIINIPVSVIKCNLITIPVVILILFLSSHNGRDILKKTLTIDSFKKLLSCFCLPNKSTKKESKKINDNSSNDDDKTNRN